MTAQIDISQIIIASVLMLALGSAFALILLIASEKLKVKEDPKVERIKQALPNLDCGACGFAGCSQYAKAVSKNPDLIGKCAPGGQKTAQKIAEILNLQISSSGVPKRPVIHCRAHNKDKTFYARYEGIPSCITANALSNAQACKFGCLGYGDCVRACKFDALHIVDGLATVDYSKCTGCSNCVDACPRNLIEMVPFSQENMPAVACSSQENTKTTRSMCAVGCIGCKLCQKQSENFEIPDNLAKIDYEKYEPKDTDKNAAEKCPTGVIVYRGKTAPADREPKQKKKKKTG